MSHDCRIDGHYTINGACRYCGDFFGSDLADCPKCGTLHLTVSCPKPLLTHAEIEADKAAREEDAHNHRDDPGGYIAR